VRVIICDDDPDIRMLVRRAFEQAGAEVEEAGDGDECIAKANDLVRRVRARGHRRV
jgi:CheY-like chemotaxis protein